MDDGDEEDLEALDPFARIEALESRCAALEACVALVARMLTWKDDGQRQAILFALGEVETGYRQRNAHAEGIDTLRVVRRLIAAPETDG